jgi:medium-chain acyl-[acyl-carrier-protein] hydrolase
MGTNLERWIPGVSKYGRHNETVRIFGFPFAGGGASAFSRYAENVRDGVHVYAVQYPGRETRWGDPPFESLRDMADAIAEDLSSLWKGTFALWGHSFGGVVALELSKNLLRRGGPLPERLLVSACRAPHLPARTPIHSLPDAEFLNKLRDFNGMSKEVLDSPDLLAAVLPIVRKDFQLFEQYISEQHQDGQIEPISIPISVFGGLQDGAVPIGDLLAWSSHTTNAFRSRFFEGGHFFAFEPQTVQEIARCIGEDVQVSKRRMAARGPIAQTEQKGVLAYE